MDTEIDLYEVFGLLKRKFVPIILIGILCSMAVGAYSFLFMKDEYTANVSMYILMKEDNSEESVTYSDMNASQMLVNDISDLAFTARVQNETIRALNLESLDEYDIHMTGEADSRVVTMSVTGQNPQSAASVANSLVSNISEVATEVMDVDSVNVIDNAETPKKPSGPNRPKLILLGFLVGLLGSACIFVFSSVLDTRISSFNQVENIIDVPVIGRIPTMKIGR